MADPSKSNEKPDDLDLEDGEIESDNDDDDVVIIVENKNLKPPNNVVNSPKNPFAQNPKKEAALSPNLLHKTRDSVKDKGNDG